MSRVLPDADPQLCQRLARAEARFQLRQRLERLVFPRLDPASVAAHVAVEGLGAVRSAMGQGRPVVVIAGHLGTHGLPPLVLHHLGVPVQVRTFQLPDGELEPGQGWGQAQRRATEDRLGIRYLRVGSEADQPDRVLAAGGVLLTTGDGLGPQRIAGESLCRGALGATVLAWPDGPYALARAHGALAVGLLLDDRPQGPVLRLLDLTGPAPFRTFLRAYGALWTRRPETWQFWDELEALEAAG